MGDCYFNDSLSQNGDNFSTLINGNDPDQIDDANSERSSTLDRSIKNRVLQQNKAIYKSK